MGLCYTGVARIFAYAKPEIRKGIWDFDIDGEL